MYIILGTTELCISVPSLLIKFTDSVVEAFYITIIHLSVCVCVRVGDHRKSFDHDLRHFFFHCQAIAGYYMMESASTASKGASSRLKEALL